MSTMVLTCMFLVLKLIFTNQITTLIDAFSLESNGTDLLVPCPDFEDVLNANITIIKNDLMPTFEQIAHIECLQSHDLIGPPKVLCMNGQWEDNLHPQCLAQCNPPPYIKNGGVRIEGEKSEDGMYKNGAFATYSCSSDYQLSPSDRKYRICEDGKWTGSEAVCVPTEKVIRCKTPKLLENGYFVHENAGNYSVGQRIHYSCNNGYILLRSATQKCTEDGSWSPKLPPLCVLPNNDNFNLACPIAPKVPHAATSIISGFQVDGILSGTEIEIRCLPKYHNIRSHCQPAKLKCVQGRWEGNLPICVFTKECPPPPDVRHGTPFDINSPRYEPGKLQRYFVNTQLSYQCLPGYELHGNEILTCNAGCWTPIEAPICKSVETYMDANGSGQILVSLATGTVVLLLLAIICLFIVCRRRKPLSRVVSIQPSTPRPDLADHAALLHHPDRLALIAFADGMQVGQPVLPTYEEATRDRGPGFISTTATSTRIQRPHWPSLVARRSRNSPNPDSIHVTRQGSLASHSASTRSDPMGSTDTMAVSENSTTVTLDTASSHSGSQPASCRAHCGSLASFDTSSVLNTEDVPLLEESELEEIQGGDAVSLAMENRSMADNGSFKLSIASDLA